MAPCVNSVQFPVILYTVTKKFQSTSHPHISHPMSSWLLCRVNGVPVICRPEGGKIRVPQWIKGGDKQTKFYCYSVGVEYKVLRLPYR